VVWIGVSDGHEDLRVLRDKIEEVLAGLFPREGKEFVAHMTIARVKHGGYALTQVIRTFSEEFFGSIQVKEFKLKRSVLTSRGPIYSDIEVYPLAEPGGNSREGKT
jgi:2'-5' RNA ligase